MVGAWPGGPVAPFSDPSWEIWTVGRLAASLPRVTKAFELHSEDVYASYKEALLASGAEIVYARDLPIVDWQIDYGGIANTIAAMMALAYEDLSITHVALHNAPHLGEPTNEQREGIAYWIGMLRGSGVRVDDQSGFFAWTKPYGGTDEN